MKKIIWIPLLIIALGVVLAWVGCASGGMQGFRIDRGGIHLAKEDRGKLVKVDENYSSFTSIDVKADYFDRIVLKEGDGFAVKGQNYERNGGLDVKLDGNTLLVNSRQERGWNLNFGLDEWFNGFGNDTWLEITYPKSSKFDNIQLDVSASNIFASGLDCKEIFVNNSFGDVDISTAKCGSLRLSADSGEISLNGVEVDGKADIVNRFGDVELTDLRAVNLSTDLDSGKVKINNAVAGTFSVTNNFGEVEIDKAEAENMTLKLNSGDLSAKNLKTGELTVKNSFGTITLNQLVFSGLCSIKNDSGDVNILLSMNEDELSYELNVDSGNVSVGDRNSGGSVSSRAAGATANLVAECSFGDIKLKFM